MNRRQTKKALTKALQAVVVNADPLDQLIRDCASLAYQINNNTDFFAWFEHSGHVDWLEARVTTKQNTQTFLFDSTISYKVTEI